jgi:hypothetical protein
VKGVGEPCTENSTQDSTGGDWKRNATASPRQPPTQPNLTVGEVSIALADTVNGYYKSEFIYGASPIRAVEDQIGPRRAERIGLATAMVKPC